MKPNKLTITKKVAKHGEQAIIDVYPLYEKLTEPLERLGEYVGSSLRRSKEIAGRGVEGLAKIAYPIVYSLVVERRNPFECGEGTGEDTADAFTVYPNYVALGGSSAFILHELIHSGVTSGAFLAAGLLGYTLWRASVYSVLEEREERRRDESRKGWNKIVANREN